MVLTIIYVASVSSTFFADPRGKGSKPGAGAADNGRVRSVLGTGAAHGTELGACSTWLTRKVLGL